jgi:predicted AAA+ superfamily ATPase
MYIERSVTAKLISLLDAFPVVALIGARQVGKTTLVKHLLSRLKKGSVYLDLELPQDSNKLTDPEQFLAQYEDQTVILDEIQRVPDLFATLRGIIDKNRVAGRFLILGSATPDLLRQSSESLAGRIAYLEMHPLSLEELPGVSFRQHWLFGGYPPVVSGTDDSFRTEWITNFIKTYIERDMSRLGLNIEPLRLQRLILLLAGINGMLLNKSMLAKSLQISVPTVSRYLDFLEGGFLLRILQPYHTNVRKRITKSPKVYFTDTGILHGVLGIHDMDTLYGRMEVGHSWEAYVLQQLITVKQPQHMVHFYQTQSGAEVDLIVTRGNTPLATFEIKFSSAPKMRRGNREAIEAIGAKFNFIVAPIEGEYPVGNNISVLGLKEAMEAIKTISKI